MSDSHRRLATIVAGLALAVTGACSDAPDPPPIVWEGEHLRFGTDVDESTICAGTLPYLDGAVGYLGEVFGNPNARVDYYWLPEGAGPYCTEHADGCADERRVYSRHAIHQHELVHAVRWPSRLYLPLEEGLADAYGDDWDRFRVQGDIHELLEDPAGNGYIPGPGYGLAAHFVSYLEANYGLDALLELDAATEYEQSYSSATTAFERVYDHPLDEVIDEYEAEYPRCGTLTFRDKGLECSRNIIEAPTELDAKVTTMISLSCEDTAVLGPRLGQRWTTRTLDVKVAGYYVISGEPMDGPLELIEIRSCDGSCFEGRDALSQMTGTHIYGGFCLEPATYLFRFAVDEEVEASYALSVTRSDFRACE